MKALKFIIIGISLIFTGGMQAQVSVNVNIGTPPLWGPSGYSDVRYYYLPDVEAYYDVKSSNFIYYSGNTWVQRSYLPKQYKNYNLYNGYKVVLTDYRGNSPYVHYKQHKIKYKKGYRGKPQKNIGYKSDNRNHKSKAKSKGHGNKK